MTAPAPAEHPAPEHHDHHEQPTVERLCDVAVIGGSAAGLAGALQLVRQRRTVIVVDDGTPRNAPAAHMHGYLGREAAPPSELVAVGREEVREYGGEVLSGRVLAVHPAQHGRFRVELTGGHALLARRVLVASGITDELPAIEGLRERWGDTVIHCPFCHGYEVRGQRLVQILTTPMGLHPTPLLHHLTDRLTVVLHDPTGIEDAALQPFVDAGVTVVRDTVSSVVDGVDGADGGLEIALGDGSTVPADAVLVGSRFHARTEVLTGLGLTGSPHPTGMGDVLETDPMGKTAVAGVFAAGNVTDPTAQVLPSAAHGSRVGAMIAFDLADEDLRAGARASGERSDWDSRYGGEQRMWSANPNGTLVAEVEDLRPGRALDVGAGEGADALWLAEHGWDATATDISAAALGRVAEQAASRGLDVQVLHVDANEPGAFGAEPFDLVSLQYGSFGRTPDDRGLANLLAAVAPDGTLLVVGHDLTPMREPVDVATQSRIFDPDAYVGVDRIVAELEGDPGWRVDLHQTRSRPPGALSTHHVNDVVLRAVRLR